MHPAYFFARLSRTLKDGFNGLSKKTREGSESFWCSAQEAGLANRRLDSGLLNGLTDQFERTKGSPWITLILKRKIGVSDGFRTRDLRIHNPAL